MSNIERDGQELSDRQRYQTLMAVSQAIISHRDLEMLFHNLCDRLAQVLRFDYLSLALHDAATNTMRLHVLEISEPLPAPSKQRSVPSPKRRNACLRRPK
jgi:hypothetical protein